MNGKAGQSGRPVHVWLPTVVLKLLVFLAFAFVLFNATVGVERQDPTSGRVCVVIAGMAGLLPLLAINRLTTLEVYPCGIEATLDRAKVNAIKKVDALQDPQVAEAARAQILRAKSPAQV